MDSLSEKVSKIVREMYAKDYKPGPKPFSVVGREWFVCLEIKRKVATYSHGFVSDDALLRNEVKESCAFYELRSSLHAIAKKYPDDPDVKEIVATFKIAEAERYERSLSGKAKGK